MRYLFTPFRILYRFYALLLFVVLMLILFPFVLIASFGGPISGGNLIYRICMLWGDLWFPLAGIRHRNIYLAPHNKKKAYIFVTNHLSFFDAAVIVKTFRQPIRPLGKEETSSIPIFGFIYKKAIVTVNRGSAEDRSRSVRELKEVLQKGISVLIFPEGTFNETGNPLKSFYDGAFKIAIETQTPIKPVLFLDSYDRMPPSGLLTINPGKSRSVFLEEIPVKDATMSDLESLRQKTYSRMEQELLKYSASWIRQK